jgi:hypothetical protein
MDGPKPYKFIRFWAMDGPKPYKFMDGVDINKWLMLATVGGSALLELWGSSAGGPSL